jgi:hypothetical protein
MLATVLLRIVGIIRNQSRAGWNPDGRVGTSFASDHTVNYRMHALPISCDLALTSCACSAEAALGVVVQSSMLARLAFASLDVFLAIPR